MPEKLKNEERQLLLKFAREALVCAVREQLLPKLDHTTLPAALRAFGASFVTLTKDGLLRGCVGALEPYQPLVEDVREHTIGAALQDFRFPPVREDEIAAIRIEVSCISPTNQLDYSTPEELLGKLHPGEDGVFIRAGEWRRATFLPQVWEKFPDPSEFMSQLCEKMGSPPDLWKTKHLEILTYQVDKFHE